MRQAIGNDTQEIGFKLDQKGSRRHNPDIITNLDFADDIALITKETEEAQDFLHRVQHNAAKIGLHIHADKIELMSFNQKQETVLKSVNNENIKKVDNFVKVRKALAWKSCNNINKIWQSPLSNL